MSRINFKIFTCSWWQMLLGVVFLWLVFTLWPIKGLLWPGNWWGNSLIVVLNDSEARPCGGFATAYGTLQLPLFKLDINNSYTIDMDLGPSESPLDRVSPRKKFWDLGTDLNFENCATDFEMAYVGITGKSVNRTILVPLSLLESWAKLHGNDHLFAEVTRLAADTDRHDEASLAERKNPAGKIMKSLVGKTIIGPWGWAKFTRLLAQSNHKNALYWSGYSKTKTFDESNLVTLSEWNLGGGKSSRYLRKKAQIDFREMTPGAWEAVVNLNITHLGGYNEPLSQTWRGGFEVSVFENSEFLEIEIEPGQTWFHTHRFPLSTPPTTAQILTPALQHWDAEFSVSVVPGQVLNSQDLSVKESVGLASKSDQKILTWDILPDRKSPFITLHKPIDSQALTPSILEALEWVEGDLVTEIHFNEAVNLIGQAYTMELIDRDFAVPGISEDPMFKGLKLLDDKVTLLLNWEQHQYQTDERFYLVLGHIEDIWGNPLKNDPRTIITR